MVDSNGQPYRNLPTAFSHLTRHIADCTCQGNAWDAEALARHRGYGQQPQPDRAKVAEQAPTPQPRARSAAAGRQGWKMPMIDSGALARECTAAPACAGGPRAKGLCGPR
jgi:hypothetical protein